MCVYRRPGPIVLVFSLQFGLGIVKIWKFDLVDAKKITIGRAILTSSPSATLCISSSFLMCTSRFGVLAGIVGEFLSD